MRQHNCMTKAHPIVRFYWSRLLRRIANAAPIHEGETVLDFGSGEKLIRQHLPPKINYISCDKEKSFNADYTDIRQVKKADVIIASSVLEHLSVQELRQTIKGFCRLKPRLIIGGTSRETSWLNKALNFVFGYTFEHGWEHELTWKQLLQELKPHFDLCHAEGFWLMQWVFVLKLKGALILGEQAA